MKTHKFPNVFIVGHPKTGTSALYQFLTQHPDIFKADNKEPNYFTKEFVHERFKHKGLRKLFAPTLKKYQELYSGITTEKYAIDATTHMLFLGKTAKRIKKYNPESKIIAIIREPVSFLQSWHSELVFGFEEDEKDFVKALELEPQRKNEGAWRYQHYSDWVKYAEQIERYLKVFPKKQVKIILFDDYKKDNKKIVREVFEFLGVDPNVKIEYGVHNRNKVVRWRWLKRLMQTPFIWIAAKKLPKPVFETLYPIYLKLIIKPKPKAKLSEDDLKKLKGKYLKEVIALEKLLIKEGYKEKGFDLLKLWGYENI